MNLPEMTFIGVDPDLHTSAWAVVDQDEQVLSAGCTKSKGMTGRDAVIDQITAIKHLGPFGSHFYTNACRAFAVEAQETSYTSKSGKGNIQDLVNLAAVAGAWLGYLRSSIPFTAYFPSPQSWKGSRTKLIHHGHLMKRLGWEGMAMGGKDPYMVPVHFGKSHAFPSINKGDWKHIMDAIGLALYALDEHKTAQHRKRTLAALDSHRTTSDVVPFK